MFQPSPTRRRRAVIAFAVAPIAVVSLISFNPLNAMAATKSKATPAAKAAPKSEKPKSEKPKSDKPKSDKPKSDKPKSDKPKSDKPKSDKPKADKPKADKPKADKPKADKPKSDKPKKADAPVKTKSPIKPAKSGKSSTKDTKAPAKTDKSSTPTSKAPKKDVKKLPANAELVKSPVSNRIYIKTADGKLKHVSKAQYEASGKPAYKTDDSIDKDKLFRVKGSDEVYYQLPDGYTVHLNKEQRAKVAGDTKVVTSWPKTATSGAKAPKKTGTKETKKTAKSTAKEVTAVAKGGPRAGSKFDVKVKTDSNGKQTQSGAAVAKAVSLVAAGTPYSKLDCSQFTAAVIRSATAGNISLTPHASTQTSQKGVKQISRSELKPGDLIESYGGGHISMYIGKMTYDASSKTYRSSDNGTEMYASAVMPGRPADIGPLSALNNIVSYGHPNYES